MTIWFNPEYFNPNQENNITENVIQELVASSANTVIEQKANAVASDMTSKSVPKTYAFDPASLLVIIDVITQVLACLKNRNLAPAKAALEAQRPGLLSRLQLSRFVQKALEDHVDESRREIRKLKVKFVESLSAIGEKLSVQDVAAMFEEAKAIA